jgi:hypothetical protein
MTLFPRLDLKTLLLTATMLASTAAIMVPDLAQAQIVISVQLAPPILPVYVQPPLPEPGYIWTPGYWAYADDGYFWVPGTWVQPPEVGVLWTPPYWGWRDGAYLFHDGYWGSTVGFYGGVNYGFGYGGDGYQGGRWNGGTFAYNRTVNNFGGARVTNVYSSPVATVNHSHVSFNGGTGGVRAEPTAAQLSAEHERHVPVTAEQATHVTAAAKNPALAASRNNGRPPIAATARPGQMAGPNVVAARPVAGREPAAHGPTDRPTPVAHAPVARAAPVAHAPAAPPTPVAHAPAARPAPVAHAPAAAPTPVAHAPAARPAPVAHAPAAAPTPVAHAPAARPAPVAHAPAAPRPTPVAHAPAAKAPAEKPEEKK